MLRYVYFIALDQVMKEKKNMVHNRYCFVRESIRKSAHSRFIFASTDRTFQTSFSPKQDSVTFLKEEPHGFKIVCRWFAVFRDGS